MKTIKYLTIIILCFVFASCVNDKVPNANEVVAAPEKKVINKTPTPVAAAESPAQATKAPSRPTENLKITLPGKTKPTASPNLGATATAPNLGATATSGQARTSLSSDEQRMTKEREDKQAEYDRNIPPPKTTAPAPAKDDLPSACDLVSAEFVSKTLGMVEARDIYVKDGSGKKAVSSRSCFFKWDQAGNVNAGVLLQIQKNPLPDEFPEWASYVIRGKRDQGDQMPDGSGTFRYKDFPGMGVAGAYNYELSRYTWRTDTDNIFMVAFNLNTTEAEQLIWAEKIGKEAMRNFKNNKN